MSAIENFRVECVHLYLSFRCNTCNAATLLFRDLLSFGQHHNVIWQWIIGNIAGSHALLTGFEVLHITTPHGIINAPGRRTLVYVELVGELLPVYPVGLAL